MMIWFHFKTVKNSRNIDRDNSDIKNKQFTTENFNGRPTKFSTLSYTTILQLSLYSFLLAIEVVQSFTDTETVLSWVDKHIFCPS